MRRPTTSPAGSYRPSFPTSSSVIAREAIENPDPALRVRAARYAMDYAVKFCDVDKVGDVLPPPP